MKPAPATSVAPAAHVVLAAVGSAGDVLPLVAIGAHLAELGHPVQLLAPEPARALVESAGLPFAAIVSADAAERAQAHPKLWHPVDGLGVLWRYLVVPGIAPTLAALAAAHARARADGAVLRVLATPLAPAAQLYGAAHADVRVLSAAYSPMAVRSVADPMVLGAWRVPRVVPRWARRLLWWLADATRLDPLVRPALALHARALGVALPRRALLPWLTVPRDGALALWDEAFAPLPGDADARWMACGAARWAPAVARTEPAAQAGDALLAWAQQGSAPLLVYPSSAQQAGVHPWPALVAALARAQAAQPDLRVLTITPGCGDAGALRASGPGQWEAAWVDLPALLPHCRAFIHHGGAGSVAMGWAAGVPQGLIPRGFDQHHHALRLAALGRGAWVDGREPRPAAWDALLKRLAALPRHAPLPASAASGPGSPNRAVLCAVAAITR